MPLKTGYELTLREQEIKHKGVDKITNTSAINIPITVCFSTSQVGVGE